MNAFRMTISAVHISILLAASAMADVPADPAASVESPRLDALSASLAAGNRNALKTFWRYVDRVHSPLIEPVPGNEDEILVTFLWRSDTERDHANVGVMSPFGERYRAHAVPEPLLHLPMSDVRFRTYRTSARVRFEYAFAWPRGRDENIQAYDDFVHEDVVYESFRDPLNPKWLKTQWDEMLDDGTWADQVRRISYAEGPDAPPEPFIAERPDVRRGKITTTEFTSALLGNRRRITVYTSPGRERGSPQCDFLLMFDRAEYAMSVPTPTILDNMQADGLLGPLVAVFVGNGPGPARSTELPGNPEFQGFLRNELLPRLRERYSFTDDPRRSVVGGSSFGGHAAAYTAFSNPDLFGNVLSQSGSYWWWPGFRYKGRDVGALNSDAGWLIHQYAASPRLPLQFYLDAGTLEGALMLLPNRMFRDVLLSKGYDVHYREFAGGHDYVVWRSTISTGLLALIGNRSPAPR